jgi:hypothetical protein
MRSMSSAESPIERRVEGQFICLGRLVIIADPGKACRPAARALA